MESLIKNYGQDSKSELKDEKSAIEIKHEAVVKAEVVMEGFIKQEIKDEYPELTIGESAHYQFICEDELHSEIKTEEVAIESSENGEVTESLENREGPLFKQEKEVEDKEVEYFQDSTILQNGNDWETKDHLQRGADYCFMCQDFGHSMASDCITCFNCGIRGHVRQHCPSNRPSCIRINKGIQSTSQIRNNNNIVEGRYDHPNYMEGTSLSREKFTEPGPKFTGNFESESVLASTFIHDIDKVSYGSCIQVKESGKESGQPSGKVENNEKESKNTKINVKALEEEEMHEKVSRDFSDDMEDAVCREFSDDMADACKTTCQICHKACTLTSMRNHTIYVHNLQITQYKQIYGNLSIIKPVYHKCHLCGKEILLDNDCLGGHIKGAHKMKEKDYKYLFMKLKPRKRSIDST